MRKFWLILAFVGVFVLGYATRLCIARCHGGGHGCDRHAAMQQGCGGHGGGHHGMKGGGCCCCGGEGGAGGCGGHGDHHGMKVGDSTTLGGDIATEHGHGSEKACCKKKGHHGE